MTIFNISTSFRDIGFLVCLSATLVLFVGCSKPEPGPQAKNDGGIFHKKTQDIGEFDPNNAANVTEDNGDNVNIVTGALGAYTPTISTLAKLQIQQSVELFRAEHGRYPKDHDEFMSKIIKQYNVQLPKLPAKYQYQYDVENHELLRVEVGQGADENSDN
jgi:hypothetical protein